MKTFKRWCEDNGRRWIGVLDGYAEFEKNAKDYEEYRRKEETREYHSRWFDARCSHLDPCQQASLGRLGPGRRR
jgi:hypothetical protein